MTSPPCFMHAIVDLSRLAKYSLLPGKSAMGGTSALIRWQVSGSFSENLSFVEGGNGHNWQGSPGHRHPVQDACAYAVSGLRKLLRISKAASWIRLLIVNGIKRVSKNFAKSKR